MSKRLIWIIVIIALIAIVGSVIFLYNGKSSSDKQMKDAQESDSVKLIDSSGNTNSDLDNTPETEFSNLETSDDDFNEIDSTIDYIE